MLNFATTFAKTSFCNATLEKCQYSMKSTFKKVKSQIRKGADPEKAAKCKVGFFLDKTYFFPGRWKKLDKTPFLSV